MIVIGLRKLGQYENVADQAKLFLDKQIISWVEKCRNCLNEYTN